MTTPLNVPRVAKARLLPRNKLRPRLGIPFVEPLHTGGCFVEVIWWMNGQGKSYFVGLPVYERLLAALSKVPIPENQQTPDEIVPDTPDELLVTPPLTWQEIHRSLAGGHSLAINRGAEHSARWAEMILFEGGRIHRAIDLPAFPCPSPIPIENAEHYYGMRRAIEKMEPAAQKALFREWTRRVGWNQSQSLGHMESDPRCPVCGETLFTEQAACTGCGEVFQALLEHKKESREEESETAEEGGYKQDFWHDKHEVKLPKGRKKVKLTPQEFLTGVLLSHQEGLRHYVEHPSAWSKVVTAFETLCGHKLPRDIAEETGESQRTIESRCERIAAALKKIAGSIRHPIIHDVERAALLESLGIPVKWEVPSTPEPRRVQPLPRPRLFKSVPNPEGRPNSLVLANAGAKT